MTGLARTRAALAAVPRLLALFDDVYLELVGGDTTVAVGGSLARGEVDQFSDLDFSVIAADTAAANRRRAQLYRLLHRRYRVVTAFDAAHIGLPALDSIFVDTGSGVVKIDALFWSAADGAPPVGGLVIHDAAGLAPLLRESELASRAQAAREVASAPLRIVGWSCYVRDRIGRGELFEAAYAIDAMRRTMLVPVLLAIAGLPPVNYRRIEARLPAGDIERLAATYPCRIDRAELLRSLQEVTGWFGEAYAALGDPAGQSAAEVRSAIALVLSGVPAQRPT